MDGAHIRTLLLTFLFRYARDLFANGHVYVGVPPLYKLEARSRRAEYLYSDAELSQHTQGLTPGSFHIQRFKARCPSQVEEHAAPGTVRLSIMGEDGTTSSANLSLGSEISSGLGACNNYVLQCL